MRRTRAHDVIGVLDIGPRELKSGFFSDNKKGLSQLGAQPRTSIYTAHLRGGIKNGEP